MLVISFQTDPEFYADFPWKLEVIYSQSFSDLPLFSAYLMVSVIFCLYLRRDTINSGGSKFLNLVVFVNVIKKKRKEKLTSWKTDTVCCGILFKPRKMSAVGLLCGLLTHLKHSLFINDCSYSL